MQGQVLQALVDCDLMWAHRLRAMAKKYLRRLFLFFGRANADQQDELAGDQLRFKVPDTLACKAASQLCSEPPGSKGPYGRGYPGPYQPPPRLDDEPSAKSGARKNHDRQYERPDQDDVLAGYDGLPTSRRHLRQLLRGDLYASESFACVCADHDIDIRAVETRAQQSTYRCVQHVARAQHTRDLAYFHSLKDLSIRRHARSSRRLNRSIQHIFGPPALRVVNSHWRSAVCRPSVLSPRTRYRACRLPRRGGRPRGHSETTSVSECCECHSVPPPTAPLRCCPSGADNRVRPRRRLARKPAPWQGTDRTKEPRNPRLPECRCG